MIRLELWNGAGGDRDKKVLRDFVRLLPELAIDDSVWNAAFDLSRRARSAGITVPATDILIAACARHHDVELEHADSDFSRLAEL
jgi:predicted nucleic acid-binding protein